ncbi:helix-turn-helix domain-containing protein [Arcobacter sp. CECT 8985]|uniref:winged helix-turn-helix transcriptional regulator n=1 Tax=Arcobacter sp. CECT 8985 TaxID=1935424 RepID=UPI00100C1086|nr:helix-turn-helix domain-containing protein [Arcobacter sp. CECT 8985]RXJ86499.1 transcriptional regulator [Arcobacter sp. CECT 8985]
MFCVNGKEYECGSKIPIDLLDDKWKFLILWNLSQGALRLSELAQKIPDTSQRTISRKLKALEDSYLIKREVYPEVPPKVLYSLSTYGEGLVEIFEVMAKWGENYAKGINNN